jgi:hypothetical protein
MLEANMNRVERILHYTNTVPEAPLALASGQRWDARNKQLLTHRVVAAAHHVDDVTAQDDVRLLDLEDGYQDDDDQKAWPTEGRIEFQNAWMRYRHDLDPVLKGINLTIEARHKGTTWKRAVCWVPPCLHVPSHVRVCVARSGRGGTNRSGQVFAHQRPLPAGRAR